MWMCGYGIIGLDWIGLELNGWDTLFSVSGLGGVICVSGRGC